MINFSEKLKEKKEVFYCIAAKSLSNESSSLMSNSLSSESTSEKSSLKLETSWSVDVVAVACVGCFAQPVTMTSARSNVAKSSLFIGFTCVFFGY